MFIILPFVSNIALGVETTTSHFQSKPQSTYLRVVAEKELLLAPSPHHLNNINEKQEVYPNQIESIASPEIISAPSHSEVALTISSLQPKGELPLTTHQNYDFSKVSSITILNAQLQHWMIYDHEKNQRLGFQFGTSLGDKNLNLNLTQGNPQTHINIIYMQLFTGVCLEQTLIDDKLTLGLNGLISEELWQQNTTSSEGQWSRWSTALDFSVQPKWILNQSWYSTLEFHNQWPIRKTKIETSQQRWHLGIGYYL